MFSTPALFMCILVFPHRADVQILKRGFCIPIDVRSTFHKHMQCVS